MGFCVATARTALHSRLRRRQLMFVLMLAIMVQVFLGAVVIDGYLMRRGNGTIFAAYWVFCLCALVFVFLLALYDILMVRSEARKKERELAREAGEAVRRARVEEEREGGAVGVGKPDNSAGSGRPVDGGGRSEQ